MTTVLENRGCKAKPAIAARTSMVSVNGVVIPRDAIARETQNHPAAKPVEAWLAAARALVVRELLLQEARRLDLHPEPAVDTEGRRETGDEAMVRALVEQEIKMPDVDETSCRRIYDGNRDRFRTGDLCEARHILIAAAPDDSEGRTAARQHAEAILATLRHAPAAFAALAAEHSACPSGKTGGTLGQIGRGQTVPEFESVLADLPVGQIAETPVETRYGFHVVAVDRRIEGRELPYELVRERIASWLREKARRTAVKRYITQLAARAEIAGIDLGSTGAAPSR